MSGGDFKTDAKVFPQAISGSNAGSSINGEQFRYNKCDPSGALFVALSDPEAGSNVSVDLLDSTQPAATGIPSARALMTGSIGLVADVAGSEFAIVERGYLDADGLAATRVAGLSSAALSGCTSANTWDRVRVLEFGENIGDVGLDRGIVAAAAQIYLGNSTGALAIGMISADTSAASINASSDNWLPTASVALAFNGSSFNRVGIGSAANLAELSGARAQLATAPGEWTLTNAAPVDTQATATRAAGGVGVRHVLRSINATLTAIAAAGPFLVVVRDGASGVGGILWSDRLTALAGTSDRVSLSGLNIVGSDNTAMTVEFTAAPGATNFETLSATGYSS